MALAMEVVFIHVQRVLKLQVETKRVMYTPNKLNLKI